jgi:hypothetical protein
VVHPARSHHSVGGGKDFNPRPTLCIAKGRGGRSHRLFRASSRRRGAAARRRLIYLCDGGASRCFSSVRGEYLPWVQEDLSPDCNELQDIIGRLSALTVEPRSENLARELAAIRDHLARIAVDNAEVERYLRASLGREPDAA